MSEGFVSRDVGVFPPDVMADYNYNLVSVAETQSRQARSEVRTVWACGGGHDDLPDHTWHVHGGLQLARLCPW